MRKISFFSAGFFLLLLLPASIIWAQTISSQKGLTTVIFSTEYGKIKVYLPDDIRPGDIISGTVVAEPNGNSAKQIKKNLTELSDYTVSIDGSKYSIDDRQGWSWQVKQDSKITTIIELLNVSGVVTGLLPIQLKTHGNQASSPGCTIPSHALTGSPVRVTGNFDGDAANTKIFINSQPAEIIAESPRSCFISFPENINGTQTMEIIEKGKEPCKKNISTVSLNVSSPKTNLRKGEKTAIVVKVSGLQNLSDTAILTLHNKSLSTVYLKPSNRIVIALEPDSVKSGSFNRQFEVQSISTGNFIININLDLPEPGNNNQYGFFCDDKCSPVGKETDASVGEVGISSSVSSNPDAEDKAFKTAKWVLENGDLFGATGNEDAALQALEKIGRTRGYVIWVKPCWKRCEEGFFCNDWKRYCGDWMPVIWVDGLENSGDNTFTATGGHTASGEGKVEGKTRKELLDLAVKVGNGLIKKK